MRSNKYSLMESSKEVFDFTQKLKQSIAAGSFLKLTLSKSIGVDKSLNNIYARLVEIRSETKISFTFRHQTKDVVKNHSVDEAIAHYLANYGELLERWDSVLDEKGVTKVELSDAELDAFRAKAADPIREAWIADIESQGLPGQELYDLVTKTLAESQSTN